MHKKIYLWIEDREGKAGFVFWKTLMESLYPGVIVESKKNNSELVKAVKALKDEKNRYIIVYDNSFDNVQVSMEQKVIRRYADMRRNIQIMNIICFEFILLEFKHLIEWIFAPDDELIEKRMQAINARNRLVEMLQAGRTNYKSLQEILDYDNHIKEHNIEQLSAKLLFDITRNIGLGWRHYDDYYI